MRNIFLIITLAVSTMSCSTLNELAGIPQNQGNGYEIVQKRNGESGGRVYIEFSPYEVLLAEEEQKLRMAAALY